MHSPELGELLVEIMLDGRAHTLDIHALRPSRFARSHPPGDRDSVTMEHARGIRGDKEGGRAS